MNIRDSIARKRVKRKKGFFIHFGVFLSVALFFFLLNLFTFTQGGVWWFFFPLLPWFIGICIHYLVVFGFPFTRVLSEEWEQEEYEKEIRKMQNLLPEKRVGEVPLEDRMELIDEDELILEEKLIRPEPIVRKKWDEEDFV